jgi:diadenosine tetraphosphate (Ap4A) HIT family hydrolase
MNAQQSWQLDPKLANETAPVGDMTLCRILAMNDATYPWLLLVPRRVGVTEIIDLNESDRGELIAEIAQAARALKEVSRCDKLNIAAIGNMVPQLHVHIVARRRDDPAWPKPVWGVAPPRAYAPEQLDAFVSIVRQAMRFA